MLRKGMAPSGQESSHVWLVDSMVWTEHSWCFYWCWVRWGWTQELLDGEARALFPCSFLALGSCSEVTSMQSWPRARDPKPLCWWVISGGRRAVWGLVNSRFQSEPLFPGLWVWTLRKVKQYIPWMSQQSTPELNRHFTPEGFADCWLEPGSDED